MFGGIASGAGVFGGPGNYSTLTLTEGLTPQTFIEPLTVDEVKSYLKLPLRSPVDTAEDDELKSLIAAARGQAEILQGRDLVTKQWDLHIDFWTGYFIELSRSPLVSVDLFTIKDCFGVVRTLVQNTDFIVDTNKVPGLVSPPYNSTWPSFTPWPSSAILLRHTAGLRQTSSWWAENGDMLKNGMKRLISDWFNNKLPFEKGFDATKEYPYSVTAALSQGGIKLVR